MKNLATILFFLAGGAVYAEMVVATQIIRPNSIITADMVTLKNGHADGVHSDPARVIGQEARTAIYPGRPVRQGDIGPPALVERNQIVVLVFAAGGLEITTEGRSLARAGVGERVRVMNLSSRNTITGTVRPDGQIAVSN